MVERSDSARAAQLGELVTGRRYLLLTVAATSIAAASAAQRLRKLSPSGSLSSAMLLFGAELMSSRVSAMIVLHFFLVAMYHAFLLLARVALGALRPLELQQTKEMLIPFVLLRCQLLVSTMEPSGHRMELGMLVAWLAALAVLRALLALTQARFQHLLTRPMTQLRDLQRLGAVLSVVIMLNLALAATCSRLASLMLLKTLELGVQVGFQSLDVRAASFSEEEDTGPGYSENSEFHLLLLQTVLSGCYLVQLVLYYLYVISVDQFRVSLFDLILILNVKNATVRLLDKIKHVKLYHQVVLDLDHLFPDATPDELESVADDVCAICLKSMCTQAKKLRCGTFSTDYVFGWIRSHAWQWSGNGGPLPPTVAAAAGGSSTSSTSMRCPICRKQVCGGKCDEMTSAEPEEHHSRQPEAEAVETRQAGQQIANNNVLGEPQAQVPAGPAAFLSRWVPFPNFSFEIVRHRGGTRNFEVTQEMLQQIWEVFPQYTLEEIRADLTRTRSVERTMERILNGRLDEQRLAMEQRNTDRADMDVSGVLGDAVIDLGEDFRWSLSTLASALWGLNLPARAPVAEAAPVAPRQQADTTGDVAPADDETQRQEAEREPLLRRLERWRGERPA
ncbi:Zinc finger, RING/FYVE/PHD-type [Phytophthora cactorum]|nr:Zinc finger, RING/FYVE/PHD-type [Phytophthora cactorum]